MNARLVTRLMTALLAVAYAASPHALAECDIESLRSPELVIGDARPIRFEKDISRRASARVPSGEPFDIKIRRTARHAQEFNNQPRYELAAYELQKLLFDRDSEVVPATALRSLPLAQFRSIDPAAVETFAGTSATLYIVQCWLKGVKPHAIAIDETRFAASTRYARAISNLNVLTYLIEHKDSNLGNVMLAEGEPIRAWAIDNGVAFTSVEGNVGTFWKTLHVTAIDRRLYERLKSLDRETFDRRLGVVAEFAFENGNWVSRQPGGSLSPRVGVRRRDGVLQLGLTRAEIADVYRRAQLLVDRVEAGRLTLLASSED